MDLPFLWVGVISATFKGPGKTPALRELFIHLRRACGNILFPLRIFKGVSPPDDFVSTNVEIRSRATLGVTGRKEKGLTAMYLFFIFFMLRWFLYLLTMPLTGSSSFKKSDESDHLNNPSDDVVD